MDDTADYEMTYPGPVAVVEAAVVAFGNKVYIHAQDAQTPPSTVLTQVDYRFANFDAIRMTSQFVGPPVDACEVYDDGSTEGAIGLATVGHIAWMHRQGHVGGATQLTGGSPAVTAISTAYGSGASPGSGPANGSPSQIAIWEDPNDDGDPNDAVLLRLINTTVANTDTDILNVTALNPPVVVTGYYFVGAGVAHPPGVFPAPWDNDHAASDGRAWIVGSHAGPINYNNLAANSLPPTDIDSIALSGLWLLRATCQ
jgi:large repetitive protein